MNDHEIRSAVISAFTSSPYKWRTPRGLAKDSSVPLPQILDFLEKSDVARKSKKSNNRGEPLYALSERYYTEQPLLRRIVGKIINLE